MPVKQESIKMINEIKVTVCFNIASFILKIEIRLLSVNELLSFIELATSQLASSKEPSSIVQADIGDDLLGSPVDFAKNLQL